MKSYSLMTFDFKNLQLTYDKDQKQVLLQGDEPVPALVMKQGDAVEQLSRCHQKSAGQQICTIKATHLIR